MKTRTRSILLALSCFFAGFLSCYFLTQQSRPAFAPAVANPAVPVAMLKMPAVFTQGFQLDGGSWHQWPDGTMQRAAPPDARPGFYDLIDARTQP